MLSAAVWYFIVFQASLVRVRLVLGWTEMEGELA
jgi:hypothetical protein